MLPITFSFRVPSTHHILSDSRWSISSHQTFVLRPNWDDDWSKTWRCWQFFTKSSPTSNKGQLVGIILLFTGRQTDRCNARTVKHWCFQLEQCYVVVECEDIEIFVSDYSLDSFDFRVIPWNIVAADKSLEGYVNLIFSITTLFCCILTRISYGSNELTQWAAVRRYLLEMTVAPQYNLFCLNKPATQGYSWIKKKKFSYSSTLVIGSYHGVVSPIRQQFFGFVLVLHKLWSRNLVSFYILKTV